MNHTVKKGKMIAAVTAVCLSAAMLSPFSFPRERTGNAAGSLADFSASPLVVSTDEKRSTVEYASTTLVSPYRVTGNCLAVRVYVKRISLPTALMSLSVTDADGKTYSTSTFSAKKATAKEYAAAGDKTLALNWNENSEFIEVPYGFYGTVYVPYTSLNREANETPVSVQSVSVGFGAQSLGYDSLEIDLQKIYVFGVYDAEVDDATKTQSASHTIADFSALSVSDFTVEGNTLDLAKASAYDMDSLEYDYTHKTDAAARLGDIKIVHNFDLNADMATLNAAEAEKDRAENYSKMGQTSEFSFVQSGLVGGNQMLGYTLPTVQNPEVSNAYSSLHFNLSGDAQDWTGAKGITCYVKNPSSTEYSVNFEIFLYNDKTDILEQYNLNSASSSYKTIYAYNTLTGEEFSYNTQTFLRVPASFEGWIRIPFSQYEAPAWTMNKPYNSQGIFNTNEYKAYKISFSRLLKSNFGSTLYFDSLGVYYNDFSVGGLFETSKPSIKNCVNGGK